jgi:hypothetical protein
LTRRSTLRVGLLEPDTPWWHPQRVPSCRLTCTDDIFGKRSVEDHPRRPPGRRPDLRDPGQPVREQDTRHRAWSKRNKVHLCLTPTNASWVNPIEPQFGPLRTFTMSNSNYPNHTVLAHALHAYLRWRNTHARHPDVLAAQRRERARVRSERYQCWGRPRAA